MKNIFLLIGLFILVILISLGVKNKDRIVSLVGTKTEITTPSNSTVTNQNQVKIGAVILNLDIANTDALRYKGLGGKTTLADNYGMLFDFGKKDIIPSFWMKDMLIPIDIIWINDGAVVKIDTNIQPEAPGTPDSQLPVYLPPSPVDYVLEIAAGLADKNNFKVGDKIELIGI